LFRLVCGADRFWVTPPRLSGVFLGMQRSHPPIGTLSGELSYGPRRSPAVNPGQWVAMAVLCCAALAARPKPALAEPGLEVTRPEANAPSAPQLPATNLFIPPGFFTGSAWDSEGFEGDESAELETYEIVDTSLEPAAPATSVRLSRDEVSRVPGTFGDPVRVVENLPGLSRVPGGLGGALIIRGANPADSGLYVDGVEVPLIYHFGGLTSVINPNFLDAVQFQPGGFGVDRGRATGGVVDVSTRFLQCASTTGSAAVDPLDAELFVCTQVSSWTVAAATRRSFVDALLPLLQPPAVEGQSVTTVSPAYFDYQLKAQTYDDNDEWEIFAFGAHDTLKMVSTSSAEDADETLGGTLAFHRLQLRHTHYFDSGHHLESALTPGLSVTAFRESSDDLGVAGKQRVAFTTVQWRETYNAPLSESVQLRFGLDHILSNWTADFLTDLPALGRQFPTPVWDRTRANVWRKRELDLSQAYFAEVTLSPLTGLSVTPGLRLSNLEFDRSRRFVLEPRLRARWRVHQSTALKGSAGVFRKLPDVMSGVMVSGFGQPGLAAERALHATVGAEHDFGEVLVTLDGFVVNRDRLPSPNDEVVFIDGRAEPVLFDSSGRGQTVGVEMLVRRPQEENRRFTGWVAYTLSRTTRTDRSPDGTASDQHEGVNAGTPRLGGLPQEAQTYLSPFDQTHILTVVGQWQLPWKLQAGFRFQFVSGNPVTPLDEGRAYFDADEDSYAIEPGSVARNSGRLPAISRLDIRVDRTWAFEAWSLTAYLEIMNVYNRRPVEALGYDYRYREQTTLRGLPILPLVGVKGDF